MLIRIYTDGACSENPGPGGWAYVFNSEEECKTNAGYELSTTNNRMELMAVLNALNKIEDISKHKNNEYEIYSDSAYVVNSINNCWLTKWKLNGWKTTQGSDIKNKDIWLKIDALLKNIRQRNIKLTIIKVKGHAGNTFNELVDTLAREQSIIARSKIK